MLKSMYCYTQQQATNLIIIWTKGMCGLEKPTGYN